MHAVKMRLILPAVQLTIAILLLVLARRYIPPQHYDTLYMPTAGFVCMGINAPATLFRAAAAAVLPLYTPDRTPWSLLGFGTEDLLFLAAVIALWYVVGQWLDKRIADKAPRTAIPRWPGVLVSAGLALFGVPLIALGAKGLNSYSIGFHNYNNPRGSLIAWVLALTWGITLTVVSIVRITKSIRMRARM
jgi:hypothetical protein